MSLGSERENDSWWAAAVSVIFVWHVGFRNYDLRVRALRQSQGSRVDGVHKGEKLEN